MTGLGKLKRPGGGKMAGLASLTQQTHGNHGIRNQHMNMQIASSLEVKGKDGKDKKGSSNVASSQPEAQAAVDVPSLPSSFFAKHHVGSPTTVGGTQSDRCKFWRPSHR